MSCHEVLTEHQKRKGPGWKHIVRYTRPSRMPKSRDRPFSGLKWSREAIEMGKRMAAREITGDAEMLRVMRTVEPNRVWTMSAIRGQLYRIRRGITV